ncbi:MAG: FAD-dependent oxidoreductase [Desulfobacteraceae bacterium]|nr:FAD-dependent oxidoreductase [Desulfobacteraceae bacterium]
MATKRYDTLIIGSGISGMAAGIILAKEGEQVLIVEQHSVPGGLTQVFQRNGLYFPTGVHRLGALKPGQPLWYYFNYLGLTDRLSLVPLSGSGFENYYFPNYCFQVPAGHQAYRQKLIIHFPSQSEAVNRYFEDMSAFVSTIELYNPGVIGKPLPSHVFTQSIDDYFNAIGIHGKLKSILYANNPLIGLSSRECPVMTHFMITDAYLNSSFRINEGQTPFAGALTQSFAAKGGHLLTGSRVVQIDLQDRTVQGVKLSTGKVLKAGRIIYSGHPSMLPGLCPPKSFRPVYVKRLQTPVNTPGLFGVALRWKKKHCPVADNDAYIFDDWDINAHYEKHEHGSHKMIFLSALPDQSPDQPEYKDIAVTALTALSAADQNHLKASYTIPGKKAYKQAKAMLADRIMDRIEQTFPGACMHAKIADTYSPVTFARYTLTPEGSAYGIKKTAQNFLYSMLFDRTKYWIWRDTRGNFNQCQSLLKAVS